MKKNRLLILLISLLCCLVFVFSACGKNPDNTDKTDGNGDTTNKTDGNSDNTNTRVKVTMNDTVVYAVINDTVTGKAFLELLPFHVTGYRADIDICCSVSEQLPNDPSEDEEWNIGEIGWFRGWFTILCDNEEQFRGQVRTIIGRFEDEYISVVTSLSGSIDITVELPSDNNSDSSGTEQDNKKPTDTLTYERNTAGTGYIVKGDSGQSTDIVIPAVYNELPVVEIGESAFAYSKHNSGIISVTIPDTVTTIGKNAFYSRQSDLITVNIGENSKLQTIGNNAFSGCRALTAIYLPAGVTSIGDSAFNNCGSLNTITVASGNTVYSSEGNNLIEIENHTLIRGSNSSVIPSTVTTIAQAAFRRATLTTLTIPVSVTSIGNYIIQDSAITSITYEGTTTEWEAVEKSRYWNMGKTDVEVVCAKTDSPVQPEQPEQPETPEPTATLTYELNTSRNGYIVTGDSGQSTDIVIPAEYNGLPVVEIGESALSWTRHLSDIVSVTIPDSVKTIGLNAFNNRQDDLTTVNIGANSQLTTIGRNAFSGCRALTAIYIPAGVTSIGDAAFNNCGGLNTITVAEGNPVYSGEGNNLIEKATHTLIRGSNSSEIPSTVTTIAEAAFRRAATLTTLTIPVSVTSIGNYIIHYSSVTSIVYEGTTEQWDTVTKAGSWNMGKTNIEVICLDSQVEEITEMYITVNNFKLKVTLEQNSSVDALVEYLKQEDITFTANQNGDFEMVGNIGHTLPRNDAPLTGEPGDVILYSGSMICLFYGSNYWSAYTKIGKIDGYTAELLKTMLGAGQGSVQVTISLK